MTLKRDKVRNVAEILFKAMVAGGAAVATSAGMPTILAAFAKELVTGVGSVVISAAGTTSDLQPLITRMHAEGARHTVDLIADMLIAWAGLQPEYENELERLAAVVSDPAGIEEDERLVQSIGKLLASVSRAQELYGSVKQDVAAIKDMVAESREDLARIPDQVAERVTQVLTNRGLLGPSVSAQATQASPAVKQVQQERIALLTAENRQLLDKEGRRQWDAVNDALRRQEWTESTTLASQLEQWILNQGEKVSPDVRAEVLLLLADVAVIQDSETAEASPRLERAIGFLNKAIEAVGQTPSAETAERIVRVRAKLDFLGGQKDQALANLSALDSPAALSLRLGMLIELERYPEASKLVAGLAPNSRWAESAIVAHLEAGNRREAEDLLGWSKSQQDATTLARCTLAYARGLYGVLAQSLAAAPTPATGKLSADNEADLAAVAQEVNPLIRHVVDSGGVPTSLEQQALRLALIIQHGLGNRARCQEAATALLRVRPVDLEIARAVYRRSVPCPDGLVDRIRAEHTEELGALVLAAILEAEVLGKPESAMEHLMALEGLARQSEQARELAEALFQVAQFCNDDAAGSALALAARLLGDRHRSILLFKANLELRKPDGGDADAILAETREEHDPTWLQLAAVSAMRRKNWTDAAKWLAGAAKLVGHPRMYVELARARYGAGDIPGMIEALEVARRLDPSDAKALTNLARGYHSQSRFADAAGCLAEVLQLDPANFRAVVDLAGNLALGGKTEEAIEALGRFNLRSDVPIEPVLMQAHLLKVVGRPKAALASLRPHRVRFWGDHRFLLAVLQLGYAAEEEPEAGEALARLVEMHRQGKIGSDVLLPGNIDTLREFMRSQWERRQEVARMHLSGRLSWILAGKRFSPSQDAYLGWRIRTQDAVVGDDPASAAEFNLYATNGFAGEEDDGCKRLVPISAPRELGASVVDASALITLHRLDLLHVAANRLGKVLVPSTYAAYWLKEQSGIDPHQPTQIRAREAILAAVDAKRIAVMPPDDLTPEYRAMLDEYVDHAAEGRLVVRIRQAAALLGRSGHLDASQLDHVQRLSPSTPLATDEDIQAALVDHHVIAEVHTLTTLHQIGLLDAFVEGMKLGITQSAAEELRRDRANVRFCAEVAGWHRQLAEEIRADPRFAMVSPPPPDEARAEIHEDVGYATDAVQLALAKGMPLIADDRMCQMCVQNGTRSASTAFGTDVLLARLAADGTINAEQHASAWLQLARWRYRFLVPTSDLLLTLANRFRNSLPGKALRDVAVYAHDCMADPGLFGGPEPVEPPLPMAAKLLIGWVDTLADLCVDVWMDERFTPEQAQAVVSWAIDNCLPAPPRVLPPSAQANMASGITQIMVMSVLHHCLELCGSPAAAEKAHMAVRCFRQATGISDSHFSAAVAGALSVFADMAASEEHKAAIQAIILRMLRIACGDQPTIDAYLLPLAEQYGFLGQLQGDHRVAEPVLQACRNPGSEYRLQTAPGPFLFVKGDQEMKAEAVFVPEMLLLPDVSARTAAAAHLSTVASPSVASLLSESGKTLGSESFTAWVPAGALVSDAMEKDFVLNHAGVRQSRQIGFADGQNRCWPSVIAPSVASLLSVNDDGYALLVDPEHAGRELTKLAESAASAAQLLSGFERLLGHLPLAKPLDLGTQVERYLTMHAGADDVWEAVWNWARDTLRPWRRYHACQALLSLPSVMPPHGEALVWSAVCEVVAFSHVGGGESLCGQPWYLHADLGKHYLRYLELYSPSMDPDRLIAVAWWAAKEVTETLIGSWRADPASLAGIRKLRSALGQDCLVTSTAWQWLDPVVTTRPGREATFFQPSPWSAALLVELGDATEKLPTCPLEEQVHHVWDACSICMMYSTAAVSQAERPVRWVWDRPLIDAVRGFVGKLPADLLPKGVIESIAIFQQYAAPQAMGEILDSLPKATGVAASFGASRLAALCRSSPEAANRLIEKLKDSAWRQACWIGLPETALAHLGQAILDAQRAAGGGATNHVPYMLLEAAISNRSSPSRSGLFIQLLVMASVSSSRVAALKTLLRHPELPSLRKALLSIRDHLLEFRRHAPPVVRARLGHVLSVLSPL